MPGKRQIIQWKQASNKMNPGDNYFDRVRLSRWVIDFVGRISPKETLVVATRVSQFGHERSLTEIVPRPFDN